MRKFLLASAAIAALTASVPASAQVSEILRQGIAGIFGGNLGGSIDVRLNELNSRIQNALQRGEISQSQASRLQDELRDIAQREQSYRNDGLSRAERDDLEQRLRQLENQIQQAVYNRGDRSDRWDDRDGRGDRWDDRNDRDNRDNRWDDRNDRWDDDDRRNGRGCPPGLARKNNGCLPPGQAKKQGQQYNNEYGRVPDRFSSQYRDTQNYIYRFNDGRIYQIDRRTGRIVRVTDVRR